MTQVAHGDAFAIPVVVLAEFLFGIQSVPRAQANKIEWGRLQRSFGFYPIDRVDAEDAADLQLSMRRKGRQVGLMDALIATLAIRHKLILLTTDRDFEFIPNLQSENWITR
jgi:predicted nucleic acid-binding protein